MKTTTKKMVLSAMFLAVGLVLPFFTGQIPQIGRMLLPMHIPVLLCGLVCGWAYGGLVGLVLPLLRFTLFGMPPLFPTGIAMTFELAAYGIVIGLCYARFPRNIPALYASLALAMVAGRAVWGTATFLLLSASANPFTWQAFMAGAFINAVPGIVLQLVLIPVLIAALDRAGVLPNGKAAVQPTRTSAN